jgi:hypothetical protein
LLIIIGGVNIECQHILTCGPFFCWLCIAKFKKLKVLKSSVCVCVFFGRFSIAGELDKITKKNQQISRHGSSRLPEMLKDVQNNITFMFSL